MDYDYLDSLQQQYDPSVIMRVYNDLVEFLISKDLLDEFKQWKKEKRREETSRHMLRFEPNSDEETESGSSSDED